MTALNAAASELAALLECENAALRRLDLPGVTGLLEAKRKALEAFKSAAREAAFIGDPDRSMQGPAQRLQDAATENKALLERAMTAQQFVMSLLAQAARQATQSKRYGAFGTYASRADGAFALCARA